MDGRVDEEDREGNGDGMYEALHLHRGASTEEVKRSYRNLAGRCHPDKHAEGMDRSAAQEAFRRIKDAYEVLVDEEARRVHDKHGEEAAKEMLRCRSQGRTYRAGDPTEDEEEGLESGPLGEHVDPEELFRRFARWRREQYEAELEATTNYRGVYVFGFDSTNVLRPYDPHASRIPELTSAAISASASVPFTRKDYLICGGNVVSRRGMGGGFVHLGWRHTFEDEGGTMVEGTTTLGARTLYTVGTSRRLGEHSEASFSATYEPDEGLTLTLSSQQDLGEGIQGEFGWTLGPAPGLQLLLHRHRGKTDVRADVKLGLSGIGISLVALRRWTKRTYGRLAARLGTSGADVEAGIGRRFNERSSAAFSLVAGIQGALAKLRITRAGGHKLVLPIALSPVLDVEAVFTLLAVAGLVTTGAMVAGKIEEGRERDRRRSKLEKELERYARDCRVVRPVAKKSRTLEGRKGGLVIVGALYGDLDRSDWSKDMDSIVEKTLATLQDPESERDPFVHDGKEGIPWIDVTDAMQFLVEKGKIHISDGIDKSGMLGFCDVAPGKKKVLQVRYLFRGRLHEFRVGAEEEALAPLSRHRLQTD